MADASPEPRNSLGLKLETNDPDSIEAALFDVFLTYLPGDSQVSAPVAAARIHQILLGHINNESSGRAEGAKPRELEAACVGGFLHAFWDMQFLLGC
ncbi:unnamed protein product [Discula destructiva]